MAIQLEKKERVFFAGCIKSMILSDGQMEDREFSELDKIKKDLRIDDFEECLDEFEAKVKDTETFWAYARKITRREAKAVILSALEELMLREVPFVASKEDLLVQLREIWRTKK